LVERAQRGDQLAFSELVLLDADRCYAIAYRILRDVERAEDAVQEALLLAWRDVHQLRDPERYGPWLHRLVVNACYAEARRHRRWSGHVRALALDAPYGPDPIVSVHDRDALERAFAELSPEQRAVFVLHHHVGQSLEAIAEVLEVPLGTVKSRLHYATRVLRGAITLGELAEDRRRGTA